MPFNDGYKPLKNVHIIDAAFKYILDTGEPVILIVNQALNFVDSMENSILCTNQVRYNGYTVNDAPKLCDSNSSHSIISENKDTELKLEMYGPVSYLQIS